MGDHIERITAAFEAFNRRDLDELVELCHPEVEWTPPAELPGSRTYHGHDGVREAVRDMIGIFPDLRAEAVRFVDKGDRVAGLYIWRGSGGESGAPIDAFEVKASFVLDFEGDLARVARFWTTWDDALAEVGETAPSKEKGPA